MLGLSQLELCGMADCGRKLLNDFENGLRQPHDRNLAKIRAALEARGATFLDCGEAIGVMADPSRVSGRTPRARSLAGGGDKPS